MNKKIIFIILGLLLLLLVSAVWVYLFFYAPTQNTETFSDFNTDVNVEFPNDSSGELVGENNVEGFSNSSQVLRQLTTRTIAGMGFNNENVVFIERGTGHMYEINKNSNSETKITGTTITRTTDAIFSPSGNKVIIISETDTNTTDTQIGTLTKNDRGEGVLNLKSLGSNIKSPYFSEDGTSVYYVRTTPDGSTGHKYKILEQSTEKLFEIPLRDIEALWANDAQYVYTKPSAQSYGNIYSITNNTLTQTTSNAIAMTGFLFRDNVISTKTNSDGTIESAIHIDNKKYLSPIELLSEKCAGRSQKILVCAAPLSMSAAGFPDEWYMGRLSYEDMLWDVDFVFGEATLLIDLKEVSGRQIDVDGIVANSAEDKFIFRNKIDSTLWMYDSTIN